MGIRHHGSYKVIGFAKSVIQLVICCMYKNCVVVPKDNFPSNYSVDIECFSIDFQSHTNVVCLEIIVVP